MTAWLIPWEELIVGERSRDFVGYVCEELSERRLQHWSQFVQEYCAIGVQYLIAGRSCKYDTDIKYAVSTYEI